MAGGSVTTGAKSQREVVLTSVDRVRDALALPALRRAVQNAIRKSGVTRTGGVALLAAALTWLVARLVAGDALYVFAYGIVVLVIISFGLAPRRLRIQGDRAGLFPRAQEGDRLDVVVALKAKRRITTFFLEERLPERLGTTVRVPIAHLGSGNEVEHHYSLQCTRRGVYEVGPLVAVAGDPVGLTRRETVLAKPYELLVHPRIVRVADRPLTRQYEDPPMRPPVSKPWPSGTELYGLREYRPGDDPRTIVWKATARTGKVMVRESEQGITDRVTIIIDTDRGSHSRDGEYSESFETGVQAAASLAVRHLSAGYEVRVESNAGPVTRVLRGADKQLGLLDALTRLELSRTPLNKMLRRIAADPRRDAHNILVTPHLSATDAAQLKQLLQKGVSVLVVALLWDPEDSETLGRAAVLGCAVAGVHPGEDLTSALSTEMGAGMRI